MKIKSLMVTNGMLVLLFQKQLEQQWSDMGFVMVAPTYERMVEDRSGRMRVVEESREVKRYGV